MLLNIYLGTTAVSWAVVFIFSVACGKKLKREGYKIVKEKKSFVEKLASFISTAFKGSIPIYNIINAIAILCVGDKFYEHMVDKLLESGKIYMPKDEPANIQPEIESSPFEKEQSNTESIQKVNCKRKYEDMSVEEKMAYLEREKEMLLRQTTSISDESLSENLDQQGPVLKRIINKENSKETLYPMNFLFLFVNY